jgi:predicted MFS family arabinose efflux permease
LGGKILLATQYAVCLVGCAICGYTSGVNTVGVNTAPPTPLSRQLLVLTLARLCLNTGIRMVYPFIPALARGLGVPISDLYTLVLIRNFAGFFSPFFGPMTDRYGRKPMMIGAMLLFSLGCLLVLIVPAYWTLGVTLAIIALAKVIYDPAMQAHLGDIVPYRNRGWAIAMTELAWAGALLLGAPAAGFLIERQGWQAPFLWLGLLGLATGLLLWRYLPRAPRRLGPTPRLRDLGHTLRRYPVIWAAALYVMLTMGANETLFIIYGDWMEASFGLSLTSLGLAAAVIGLSEITGELGVGTAVDRLGKRPVVIVTGILNVLFYLTIPYLSPNLTTALITLFLLFLTFEMTVVGSIPLLTEVVPQARGLVMSMTLAAGALGRTAGATIGPIIWERAGFHLTGLVAAVIMGVALIILTLWVREGSD